MENYPWAQTRQIRDYYDFFALPFCVEHLHTSARGQHRQIHHHDVASVGVVEVPLHKIENGHLIPPAVLSAVIENALPFPWVNYFHPQIGCDVGDCFAVILLFLHPYDGARNENFLSHALDL